MRWGGVSFRVLFGYWAWVLCFRLEPVWFWGVKAGSLQSLHADTGVEV